MNLVLYIGEVELDVADDLPLMRAASVKQALGIYVHYMPDVVIFDGESIEARLAFEHLADVAVSSPYGLDALLVVNARGCCWDTPDGAVLHQVPEVPDAKTLRILLDAVTRERRVRLEARHRKVVIR